MSGFKIGDLVTFPSDYLDDPVGEVVLVREGGAFELLEIHVPGNPGTWKRFSRECRLVGPKPLALNDGARQGAVVSAPSGILGARTGGRVRFTVRRGWTTRQAPGAYHIGLFNR